MRGRVPIEETGGTPDDGPGGSAQPSKVFECVHKAVSARCVFGARTARSSSGDRSAGTARVCVVGRAWCVPGMPHGGCGAPLGDGGYGVG